jgi:hypothetical protein
MTKLTASLLAASLALLAAPAFAADLPAKAIVAAAAPAPTTTITLEGSPEFTANSASSSYQQLADVYGKGTVSHVVAPGWSVAAAVQGTVKTGGLYQYYAEVSGAYKAKLADNFSVSLTGGVGGTWGTTGYVSATTFASTGTDPFAYYFISASADLKLDSHWTWNAINARYRNAFGRTWLTPKVSTGITYNIDATDAVYANIGYSWKDQGDGKGLLADKFNVAVGYKYSF